MLSKLRPWTNPLTEKLFGPLGRWIHPNYLSIMNLLFGMAGGYLCFIGRYGWAGLLVLMTGLLDSMDGAIARANNLKTEFGAVMDATFDRLSEGFIFFGMSFQYPLAVLALILSYGISHVGVKEPRASKGIAERGERLILVSLFLFIGQIQAGLILLCVLATITLIMRMASTWQINHR